MAAGLRIFGRKDAPLVDSTAMMSPPTLDDAARQALPRFRAQAGSVTKLLFGDPAAESGLSLVWARFGPNYHLPRHSHSVDCVYYIVSGGIRMGSRHLGAGEGFFVAADAPYSYVAGPDGVEILEFRGATHFDSQIRETADGWGRVVAAVEANRERWAVEVPRYS